MRTAPKRQRWFDRPAIMIPVGILGAVVLFGAAAVGSALYAPPAPKRVESARAADREIITFTGSGMGATRPFAATGPWEAQFSGAASFTLMSSDGQMVDVMGGNADGAPGTFYDPKPGTYYLDVSAIGAWRVRIVSVE